MEIDPTRRREIADALGLHHQYLYQCLTGRRAMDPADAVRAETVSAGQVRRWHVRPDDWHRIWPELIGADGAPPVVSDAPAVVSAVDGAETSPC